MRVDLTSRAFGGGEMKKAALEEARKKLFQMKEQLLEEFSEDLGPGRDGAKEDGMDTYDLASSERDREISLLLTDREREKLWAIDDALERIEDGTYGICENCESEIAPKRLEAMPFTRLCVSCQSEQEKRMKLTRRGTDDRIYRRLASAEIEEENG